MLHFLVILLLSYAALSAPPKDIKMDTLNDNTLEMRNLIKREISYKTANNSEVMLNIPQSISIRRYRVGKRVEGDEVVHKCDGQLDCKTHPCKVIVKYPQSGEGSNITHLVAYTFESNKLGRGYVISGGIGQRSIEFAIENEQTDKIRYAIVIYGI